MPHTSQLLSSCTPSFSSTAIAGSRPLRCICLAAILLFWGLPGATAQNSTAKNRLVPSKMASKIGSAVDWETDVDVALAKARETGKPVFWYVPTIPGSFMDRKTEIDRYMKAGPFSWPAIIDRLNQHFVPLMAVPDGKQAADWNLVPYEFVEPGFVVLDSNRQVAQRVDQLTSLHPTWLLQLIGRDVPGVPPSQLKGISSAPNESAVHDAWSAFYREPGSAIDIPTDAVESVEEKIELELLRGMQQYYTGDHQQAQATWRAAAMMSVDSPLAWKCAAEREGFGPFVRGFEVLDLLPAKSWLAGSTSRGSAAPAGTFETPELWRRSLTFLLRMQREDGAIVDSDYDFGGTDSLPNVHVAVTSLAGRALLFGLPHCETDSQKATVTDAIQRAHDFVVNPDHINPVDRDEILWAYAYRLDFLCHMKRAGWEVDPEEINTSVRNLEEVQSKRGAWYHEYANSFVTATALVALHGAKQLGATVSEDKVKSGLEALQQDRFANGAFPYSSTRRPHPPGKAGDLAAAAGRMPICERALVNWKASDTDRLNFAVQQSFQHFDKLRVAYKYDNHTSTLAYGGFFFWYDLQSRADAIADLPAGEAKVAFARQLMEDILALPELDGRFVDSHELGRAYGTSMALIAMGTLEPILEEK